MLVLKRSILTEKIARRGYHLSRACATDPLEILFVREVMRVNIAALPSDLPIHRIRESLRVDPAAGPQRLYPVVDSAGRLEGVVTRFDLTQVSERAATEPAHQRARSRAPEAGGRPSRTSRCVSSSTGWR